MADADQVAILLQSVKKWNECRQNRLEFVPDLSGAHLNGADLSRANLRGAKLSESDLSESDLSEAHLNGANLSRANLRGAKLSGADLSESDLSRANLNGADLSRAHLYGANLSMAKLSKADLRGAYLSGTNLSGADLIGADLNEAKVGWTVFGGVDLSVVKALESVQHDGPSTIGLDTIYRSGGKIPESFLLGAGVPNNFITFMHSLVNPAIQFYSCFISYSTKDQNFADRLYADLQHKGVRCWFAPHHMRSGKKIHEQIDEAIRLYDRLLVVLSPDSIESEWVKTEIAKARKREVRDKLRVLFPIRLVSFETLREWECFDADTGKDSAREIREYYVPDFSAWKTDHDAYQRELSQLIESLNKNETRP